LIERTLNFLIRLKNGLRGIEPFREIDDTPDLDSDMSQDVDNENVDNEIVGAEADDYDDYDEDADPNPLTWAELKNVRKELRRFLTWHALRTKVPKGWESPE